jgi:hypothetical protein
VSGTCVTFNSFRIILISESRRRHQMLSLQRPWGYLYKHFPVNHRERRRFTRDRSPLAVRIHSRWDQNSLAWEDYRDEIKIK